MNGKKSTGVIATIIVGVLVLLIALVAISNRRSETVSLGDTDVTIEGEAVESARDLREGAEDVGEDVATQARRARSAISEGINDAGEAIESQIPNAERAYDDVSRDVGRTINDLNAEIRDPAPVYEPISPVDPYQPAPEVRVEPQSRTIGDDLRNAAGNAGSALGRAMEKTGNAITAGARAAQEELAR